MKTARPTIEFSSQKHLVYRYPHGLYEVLERDKCGPRIIAQLKFSINEFRARQIALALCQEAHNA